MSTALVVPAGVTPEELEALQQQQSEEFDTDLLQTPILKIGQPLTKEVSAGDADAGEFINTLTGEGLGETLSVIPAYYQKGRFYVDRDSNRAYVAFGDTIPEGWSEAVGEEFVGTSFKDHPDAEETYSRRANAKEIEWKSGPPISTTHNFTVLAIVNPAEGDEDGEVEYQPVRLSLQRTNMPIVRKWLTLIKSNRNSAIWDFTYDLGTEAKDFARGRAYLLTVKKGRKTDSEEKGSAVELAQAVAAGRVSDNSAGDVKEDRAAPAAEGALEV